MGRLPSGKAPSQAIQMIRSRHREIMRLQIAGWTNKAICQKLNYSEAYLSVIVCSPLYKRELARMSASVDTEFVRSAGSFEQRLEQLKPKALDVLEELLSKNKVNGQEVPLRLKRDSARDILEIAGAGKKGYADGMNDFAKFISEAYKTAEKIAQNNVQNAQPEAINVTPEPPPAQIPENVNNTVMESPIPAHLLPTEMSRERVVNE
jgi:hypothetical protein